MKDIDIKKIPKEVLIAGGASILLIVFFVNFVFMPMIKRVSNVKRETANAVSEARKIREAMGSAKSVDEALSSMKKRMVGIEHLFPRKEESILSALSSLATKMGMEVGSISPQKKRVINDIDGVSVKIKNSFVMEMPVSMSARARYKSLGDFIIKLRDDFPMLIKVDSVDMSGSGREDGMLTVNLQMNSYMLSDTAE